MAQLDIRGIDEATKKLREMEGALERARSGFDDLAKGAEAMADGVAGAVEDMGRDIDDSLREGQTAMEEFFGEALDLERVFHVEAADMREAFADGQRVLEDAMTAFTEGSAEDRLSAMGGMFEGMSGLLARAGEDNKAAALGQKIMASAEAAVNTAKAVTVALGSAPPPLNFAMAAAVGAMGVANIAKINSTPIPSAETGGRFEVPGGGGVDGALLRVNPGEEVDVTPRGDDEEGAAARYVFKINEQVIFDIVTKGIRSGEIVMEPAANV
jgi:hypothetical protein